MAQASVCPRLNLAEVPARSRRQNRVPTGMRSGPSPWPEGARVGRSPGWRAISSRAWTSFLMSASERGCGSWDLKSFPLNFGNKRGDTFQLGCGVDGGADAWNRVTEQSSAIRLRDAKVFHRLTEGVP